MKLSITTTVKHTFDILDSKIIRLIADELDPLMASLKLADMYNLSKKDAETLRFNAWFHRQPSFEVHSIRYMCYDGVYFYLSPSSDMAYDFDVNEDWYIESGSIYKSVQISVELSDDEKRLTDALFSLYDGVSFINFVKAIRTVLGCSLLKAKTIADCYRDQSERIIFKDTTKLYINFSNGNMTYTEDINQATQLEGQLSFQY